MKLASVVTAGLLLLALATIVTTMGGCSSERETASAAPETVGNVSVLSVQPANVPDLVEAVGTLRAAQTSPTCRPDDGEHRRNSGTRRRPDPARTGASRPRRLPAASRCRPRDRSRPCRPTGNWSEQIPIWPWRNQRFKRYQTLCTKRNRSSPQEFDEVKGPSTSGSRASRYGKVQGSPRRRQHSSQSRTAPWITRGFGRHSTAW
jgi:hypothetical protein